MPLPGPAPGLGWGNLRVCCSIMALCGSAYRIDWDGYVVNIAELVDAVGEVAAVAEVAGARGFEVPAHRGLVLAVDHVAVHH